MTPFRLWLSQSGAVRQGMINKGTVNCDELQSFHMALGKQQPVEGVACGWFGIEGVEYVREAHGQYR